MNETERAASPVIAPTPWRWSDEDGYLSVMDADGEPIAGIGDMEMVDGVDLQNAEFMAAAPDLYAALELALGAWYQVPGCEVANCSFCREIQAIEAMMRAALAKARGIGFEVETEA